MGQPLHQDKAIQLMIDAVYEDETSRPNWDTSFIESIKESYHSKGGLTDRQLAIVKKRYEKIVERDS